jgi:hypothetical protein
MTIAKIGGAAGKHVFDTLTGLVASRLDKGDLRSSGRWLRTVRRSVFGLVEELDEHCDCLPVLYYSQHVDMWCGAELIEVCFGNANPRRLVVLPMAGLDIACYMLPDKGFLRKTLEKLLRSKRVRERLDQERRWYILGLLEATLAWEELALTAAIVVIRRRTGASARNEEVKASLRATPKWLANCRKSSSPAAMAESRSQWQHETMPLDK